MTTDDERLQRWPELARPEEVFGRNKECVDIRTMKRGDFFIEKQFEISFPSVLKFVPQI